MRTLTALMTLPALLASSAALAQAATAPAAPAAPAAPTFAVGAKVFGPQQNDVGTISRIVGDNVVVSTGKHEVTLGKAAFAQWPKGLVIAMTRDQLDAAFEEATAKNAAALNAALVVGAETHSIGGANVLGTVKSMDDQFVVLTTDKGDLRIPRTGFVMGPAGLSIGLTAEQFNQAVQQSAPAASANSAAAATPQS